MIILKLDNTTGKVLDTYNTLKAAAEDNNCSASGIREACYLSHNGRTLKGYRWFAMDSETKRNYYNTKPNGYCMPLTVEETNEVVFKRVKEIEERRQKTFRGRPNTLKIVCNKCLNTGNLNSHTTFNTLKEDNEFLLVVDKNNELSIKCTRCNTKIKIGEK